MSTSEQDCLVFTFLQQQNCCLRCCFRFIGWKAWRECYNNPIASAKTLGYITEDASITDTIPCVTCLGILQNETLDLVAQKIQTEVEKENYDSDTFSCALTVPMCVSLRERILHTQWINKFTLAKDELHHIKKRLETVKDIWKALITPKLEQAVGKKVDLTTPSAFLIEIILTYKDNDKECEALENICVGANSIGKKRRRNNKDNRFSRKSVETLVSNVTHEEFDKFLQSFSLSVSTSIDIGSIVCSHSSIFIGGRYSKLSREISQTPWFINGEKKMETSVQDLLCNPIADAVKAQSIKFLSSGREDVDVRTLYSGRPFAVELINPRMTKITDTLLSSLIQKINRSSKQVQITTNLKVLSRLDLQKLKEGETVKTKMYRAICVCRTKPEDMLSFEKLNNLKRIEIVQKTPLRVLHRRPLSPRIRVIYEIRARWMKPQELQALNNASEDPSMFFVLDVKTQAGTYVKEFVHGDFGRTKPSLCDILKAEVDIVTLDVTGINLDWP